MANPILIIGFYLFRLFTAPAPATGGSGLLGSGITGDTSAFRTAAAIAIPIPPGQASVAGLMLALLTVSLAGVVITVNLIWPRLAWDNPRRQTSGVATPIGFVAESGAGATACGALILSITLWSHSRIASATAILVLYALLLGTICLAFITGPRLLRALLSSDRIAR